VTVEVKKVTDLQWSASQQYTMWRCVVRVEHLCQLAMMILHAMPLINDHVLPTNLQSSLLITTHSYFNTEAHRLQHT